jgi:hypothetical protein
LNRDAGNWSKEFLCTTDIGSARIRQVACTGIKCDLMDSTRWGWECILQLQEVEDKKPPAATTWAAEFLLREGESREFLGLWITSKAIHEAKRRRATPGYYILIPMWEVATHNWRTCEPRLRAVKKRKTRKERSD